MADIQQPTQNNVIRFTALVGKVATLADGGIRITLDLQETDIQQASDLMRAKQAGALLDCALVAVLPSAW